MSTKVTKAMVSAVMRELGSRGGKAQSEKQQRHRAEVAVEAMRAANKKYRPCPKRADGYHRFILPDGSCISCKKKRSEVKL